MRDFYKIGSEQVLNDLGLEKDAVAMSGIKSGLSWARKSIPGFSTAADFTRGNMLMKPVTNSKAYGIGKITGLAALPGFFQSLTTGK